MSYIGDKFGALSASITSTTGSLSSALILGTRADRNGLKFYNDTNQSVYISFATSANTGTLFVHKLPVQTLWEPPRPIYAGPVSIIYQTIPTTGSLLITETI